MKSPEQLEESIDRFQRGFWDREELSRPPLGVSPDRSWLPVNYLRAEFANDQVLPSDVNSSVVRSDYEDASLWRKVRLDDWMPYSAPWRAVPWLEAISGCRVPFASGSLSGTHFVEDPRELASLEIPATNGWLDCLRSQTQELVMTCPPDCFISPSILRGPSDVIAALRGLNGFFLDLYDAPDLISEAIRRIGSLTRDVLDMHFELVQPKLGGYGYIYGYWAPGPTVTIQEDMMGLASPGLFRDLFLEQEQLLVDHLGPHTFFHVHSTGYDHYRHILEIAGLAGIQLTVEANGPSLGDLVPVMEEILGQTRLIVFVDAYFEELVEVVRKLPRNGLYVMVSDKFIDSDVAFKELVRSSWG
ncbi:MAG: hypothetical protein ABSG36_06275 [Acidimicrobiales bacterium]|jgi:hypothetical protein